MIWQSFFWLLQLFLIFNIVGVLINSISTVYRKMAVAHGKGKQLYFFWVFAQLISAVLTYALISKFEIIGLLFIIPLNAFLMGVGSYVVYKKLENSIKYNFITRNNLIVFTLFSFAVLLKFCVLNYLIIYIKALIIPILIVITIVLSLYPLYKTYKLFKHE